MAKVLLLEEDAVAGGHLRSRLAELGCDVVHVREGGEGLARAVTERFDLILVSAELPGVNGFRICNRIRKDANVRKTPIFLMSDQAVGIAEHRQLPTRADEYFEKPVRFDELAPQIRRTLGDRGGDAGLGGELARTQDQLAAVVMLETRLTEQERTIASLSRELATARAAVAQQGAPHKPNAPPPPPPRASVPSPADTTPADAADARRIARLEKQLAAAHADRELAGKRAKEAGLRLDKMRGELAAARAEWQSEREKLERLAAIAGETADAAAVAIASEREQLVIECEALRERVTRLDAERKAAQGGADRHAEAASRARAEAEQLRAEVERTKRETGESVSVARRELADLRTRLAKELARELDAAHEEMHRRATDEIAQVVARAGDLVRATMAQLEKIEAERDARIAERDASWQKRLDEAVAAEKAARENALRADRLEQTTERGALERDFAARAAAAEARMRTLEAERGAELAAHLKTRATHAAQRAELVARIEALEALAASRAEDMADLERDVEAARLELPQLEAEIVVLRGELMSVRRQLDLQEVTSRAAQLQLERDREIVARARELLGEADPGVDVA